MIYNILQSIIIIVMLFVTRRVFINIVLPKINVFKNEITIKTLIADVSKYVLIILSIVGIMYSFNINLYGLLISFGLLSVIIGFSLKDLLGSVISGFFVISDDKVVIGDYITTESFEGIVIKTTLRTTTLLQGENERIVIPNLYLSQYPYKIRKSYKTTKRAKYFYNKNRR